MLLFAQRHSQDINNKKLSYHWQTARRVYRSVKVTKHGTIQYVTYDLLLVCYINFVRKMHRFFRY